MERGDQQDQSEQGAENEPPSFSPENLDPPPEFGEMFTRTSRDDESWGGVEFDHKSELLPLAVQRKLPGAQIYPAKRRGKGTNVVVGPLLFPEASQILPKLHALIKGMSDVVEIVINALMFLDECRYH